MNSSVAAVSAGYSILKVKNAPKKECGFCWIFYIESKKCPQKGEPQQSVGFRQMTSRLDQPPAGSWWRSAVCLLYKNSTQQSKSTSLTITNLHIHHDLQREAQQNSFVHKKCCICCIYAAKLCTTEFRCVFNFSCLTV